MYRNIFWHWMFGWKRNVSSFGAHTYIYIRSKNILFFLQDNFHIMRWPSCLFSYSFHSLRYFKVEDGKKVLEVVQLCLFGKNPLWKQKINLRITAATAQYLMVAGGIQSNFTTRLVREEPSLYPHSCYHHSFLRLPKFSGGVRRKNSQKKHALL